MNAILLFTLVALGGSALAAVSRARSGNVWRDIVDAAGGEIEDLGGLGLEIRVVPNAMPIRIVSIAGMVRMWSAYPVAGGPRFYLGSVNASLPAPERKRLVTSFGPEMVPAELPSFRLFSSEHHKLPQILDRDTCQHITSHFPSLEIAGHRRVIELLLPGRLSLEQARTALWVLTKITNSNLFGVESLLSLPGAAIESWPTSLDDLNPPLIQFECPHTVYVGPTMTERGEVATAVSAPAKQGETFRSEVSAGGSLEDEVPKGAIPIAAAMALGGTGRGTLIRDRERVIFQWPSVEEEPGRLLAAARLVSGFNDDAAGSAYR